MNAPGCTYLSVVACLSASLWSPTSAAGQETSAPVVIGESVQIESDILGETRPLMIGTPAGYESGEATPNKRDSHLVVVWTPLFGLDIWVVQVMGEAANRLDVLFVSVGSDPLIAFRLVLRQEGGSTVGLRVCGI